MELNHVNGFVRNIGGVSSYLCRDQGFFDTLLKNGLARGKSSMLGMREDINLFRASGEATYNDNFR